MASTLQSAFRALCHNKSALHSGLRCFSATSQMAIQLPLVNRDLAFVNYSKYKQNVTSENQKLTLQYKSIAQMSYDSTNKIHNKINNLITKGGKRVFVFMKGVPKAPACGYSNVVVQILEAYGVEFDSFDVLEDDEVRQEIKAYSEWPTIPQVYVDGNFVGGCDILLQMHQSGELKQLFEEKEGKGTEG